MQQPLITGIDHPAVAAHDVEALSDWYCRVLGYTRYHRNTTARPPDPVWILQAPDGTLLEIMPKDATPRPDRTTWTPGWSHLALRVANLDEAIKQLEELDVTGLQPIIPAIGGGRVCTFADPDGNMLQLVER